MKEKIVEEIIKRIKDHSLKECMYLEKMDSEPEFKKYYEREYKTHYYIILELKDLLSKVKEL